MNSLIISAIFVYIVIPFFVYIFFKLFGEKKVEEEYRRMSRNWR